ncbi:MAG: ABC transporter permease [Acidimicrobiia bacterium]|nr:ABC transporter permease [Acidimicrobiia bacterium]NNF64272.1 ABC transporter permease [Acidimicrobiia bacterium]
MVQYVARRLLYAIPVLIGILLVTFILARLIPGDPCKSILGEKATPAVCEVFAENKGLNEPMPVQLALYAQDVIQGDLGDSIRFSRPVAQILVERLPMTIELSTAALFLALLVGIPLGIISAMKHNTSVDVGTMVFANVGVSMPVFWLGLMLIYLFAALLGWLPPSGRLSAGFVSVPFYEVWNWSVTEDTFRFTLLEFISNHFIFNSIITGDWEIARDAIRHLVLPAIALSTIPTAIIARMTRSSLLDVMGRDYIRTARAKGAPERSVVIRHGLRNAMLPVVTIIGLQLGALLSGAVLTETVFSLAGVGTMLFEAITARDFPIIQGFVVVIATGYVLVNLLVDISYAYLDPRIRLE